MLHLEILRDDLENGRHIIRYTDPSTGEKKEQYCIGPSEVEESGNQVFILTEDAIQKLKISLEDIAEIEVESDFHPAAARFLALWIKDPTQGLTRHAAN